MICQTAVVPGAVIRSRPIGALLIEDEHGGDEKIVAVPVDALHSYYTDVREPEDLPPILREQIAHFFQHYKDLEHGKWVSVGTWIGADAAATKVREAVARYIAQTEPHANAEVAACPR